ncbi:aldo/keto reductase [Jonesia quinghaiensis]|uniref:aldo/keto reductase n=1 Tax=Jonesia quinghaiensis TaxID=262806 RepID=UPI0004048611|nr:aldo/keto reductase [Jonesia quinghaiensis]
MAHPYFATSTNGPELRTLGRSGLTVSVVGLGCNNLGRPKTATESLDGSQAVIDAALDAGITFFDVADMYGSTPGVSEEILGTTLGSRRNSVIVATKFGLPANGVNGPEFGARGSRRYIMNAVEASLRRLKTDYIDLYQFHTPDPLTPIEETLRALDDLIASGKVRYIGHSNQTGWQIADAEHTARALGSERFISAQNHYNLLDRRAELEVTPAAQAYGLGVLPYFPLANGLLTGKYTSSHAPADGRVTHTKPGLLDSAPWEALEKLDTFARERDLTMLDVAFSWLAAQPAVSSVIAGATRPDQIVQNAQAVRELSAEDVAYVDSLFPAPDKVALF